MKIVFFGCDDFAQQCLERVIADGHEVLALITQPDRPKGRGLQVCCSPTKALASQHNIDVFQPHDLKSSETVERIKSYQADIFIVVAYGHFLPDTILSLPKYFCLNVHPSLLPKYRGAAPINWPLIHGETETGVTLIRINASMDAGDIVAQEVCPITPDMNAQNLRQCLAQKGAQLLSQTLPVIEQGNVCFLKQDISCVTIAPKLNKELGLITWDMSAAQIHCLVRGTYPWPGAYIFFKGQMLKILETAVFECTQESPEDAGKVIDISPQGMMVQTAQGMLLIKRVHLASSKPIDASAFARGQRIDIGFHLKEGI